MSDDIAPVVDDGTTRPEDFRYFFVYFMVAGGGFANTILKQTPSTIDNGFNMASSSQFLMDKFQCPVVICSWQETNYVRYDQYIRFLKSMPNRYSWVAKQKPSFGVVEGGKEKGPTQDAPILSIIKPEDPRAPQNS